MPPSQGGARLSHVTSIDSDTAAGRDDIESFWETAVESQCEGLMVKVRFSSVSRLLKGRKEETYNGWLTVNW